MDLDNHTSWPAQVFTGGVPTGSFTLASLVRSRGEIPDGVSVRGLVVVKATLKFQDRGWQPAAEQLPIWEFDQEGPPFFEKDIMFQKGGVDLAIIGSARPSDGPVEQMEVSIRLGTLVKKLMIFGDRTWLRQRNQFVPSAPKPFTEMPLIREKAFGGTTVDEDGNPAPSPLNATGKGYTLPNARSQVEGVPLPNVEDPAHLIRSIEDRPEPVGLDFLPFTNGLRLRAGLTPRPAGPPDVSPRVHNAAHPDLVLTGYPTGETLEVGGMTVPGPWRAVLPPFPARAALRGPKAENPLPLQPDTICLLPDRQLMYLTAKGRFDYDLDNPPDLKAVVYPLEGSG